MDKIAILLILVLAPIVSNAQEVSSPQEVFDKQKAPKKQDIKTIFDNDNFKSITGFGSFFISYTSFNKSDGVMSGVRGGAIFNRKLTVGFTAMSFENNSYFVGNDLQGRANTSLILSNSIAGLYLEYHFNIAKPIHISVPLGVLAGDLEVKNNYSDLSLEQDIFVAFEPGINIEFNVAKFFVPCVTMSYRQAFGVQLQNNITNRDISGFTAGVLFKFGRF